ncbi:MAG: SAM-dependent methyltransferase [Anaerobutyricum soehngenii]
MKGKLYGIGVGPGDPELLTLKAKRLIEECDIVAVPVKKEGEDSVALNIAKGMLLRFSRKRFRKSYLQWQKIRQSVRLAVRRLPKKL